LLLIWYVFWGFAIKPKSIPGILHGQLAIWTLYAVLILVFIGSLRRSRHKPTMTIALFTGPPFGFSWRGFVLACVVATAVTTVSRLVFFRFAGLQVVVLFSFYVVAGLGLFAGSLIYAGALSGIRPHSGRCDATGTLEEENPGGRDESKAK